MHRQRIYPPILVLFLIVLIQACADPFVPGNDTGPDANPNICDDPQGDFDNDGITNLDEGCTAGINNDTDEAPDWKDQDSDNDGLPDSIEKGIKDSQGKCTTAQAPKNSWPCDHDGDGRPDYADIDSDGDGIDDSDEDVNGDGFVGCCVATCQKPSPQQQNDCVINADGCGPGQACQGGKCTPSIGFNCSNGETSPTSKISFDDGKLDSDRGTFICRDASEDNPKGRKAIETAQDNEGSWNVAFAKDALVKYGKLTIQDLGPKQSAAIINDERTDSQVAGFVLSRDSTLSSVQDELAALIQAIVNQKPGGNGSVTVRGSGTAQKSHDRFDSVQGTVLDVALDAFTDASTVRNQVMSALLGIPLAKFTLPPPFGDTSRNFVIRFTTVKRVEFKKDNTGALILDGEGNPIDSGDQSKWRLVIMGGIATSDSLENPNKKSNHVLDDFSNGTGLASADDTVVNECDVATITALPIADIIWVVDESGSMDDQRDDVVKNASNFFSQALAAGLDFRMGVTNVVEPSDSNLPYVGKFCSRISNDASDDGGEDRFLLPTEQSVFESCIRNPTWQEFASEYGLVNSMEAVKRHLPRQENNPTKIRPNAKLVIIAVSDELPESLQCSSKQYPQDVCLGLALDECNLDSNLQSQLNTGLQPYIDFFSGKTNPEAEAIYHTIGGVCNNSCSAHITHGYNELAQQLGGQIGDVCQKDLKNTLQIIIDSIVAAASPIVLEYVPISASLAVAIDGQEIPRFQGTQGGFAYRESANSLALINVKFEKGSEVVSSYKRWKKQEGIDI